MQTLSDLKAGRLKGSRRLTLSEGLTTFPEEIFELADTLEFLDLSNNLLTELPETLPRLKKLKIAFFSNNRFTKLPAVFKGCEKLTMLGFKANQIEFIEEDILPLGISWLILTDNRISSLPRSIGKLTRLQKFPLAGNQLSTLPDEMAACRSLELLRLSANRLTQIPSWLLQLPKLSWLAFSGNPCSLPADGRGPNSPAGGTLPFQSLQMGELLGEGASGQIFKAFSSPLQREVAVKLFKGSVTSDGYAKDEIDAYMRCGDHPHLIKVLARIQGSDPLGLVLSLIPPYYENLGLPPSFESCTRDTFKAGTSFDLPTVTSVAKAIVAVCTHLHGRGLMHGDLYAHNILLNPRDRHCYLGDFGAATFYDATNSGFEKIEVRAFGCLLDDLLRRCPEKTSPRYRALRELSQRCTDEEVSMRPLFSEIVFEDPSGA